MDWKYTLVLRNGFLYAQCHLHARKTGRVEINLSTLYTSVFEFSNMHWKVFYERISQDYFKNFQNIYIGMKNIITVGCKLNFQRPFVSSCSHNAVTWFMRFILHCHYCKPLKSLWCTFVYLRNLSIECSYIWLYLISPFMANEKEKKSTTRRREETITVHGRWTELRIRITCWHWVKWFIQFPGVEVLVSA